MLAAVAGAHGLKGEVRLKLLAESLDSLRRHATFDANGRALTLTHLRDAVTGPIARFTEIASRDAAEALRGTTLTVPRAALPPAGEGEYYVADLIGLPAHVHGVAVGRVVAVENYGAGDLIEVEREGGGRFIVPFARCEVGEGVLAVDQAFVEVLT